MFLLPAACVGGLGFELRVTQRTQRRSSVALAARSVESRPMNIFKRLAEKPWIHEPGAVAETRTASFAVSNQKVALVLFLAIVGVLFFLFFAAYHMRIELTSDWVAIPEPPLLWFNTVVLGIASVAFEWARGAARSGREGTARTAFLVAGALTLSFLVLQLVVWDQMLGLGYFAHSNPRELVLLPHHRRAWPPPFGRAHRLGKSVDSVSEHGGGGRGRQRRHCPRTPGASVAKRGSVCAVLALPAAGVARHDGDVPQHLTRF